MKGALARRAQAGSGLLCGSWPGGAWSRQPRGLEHVVSPAVQVVRRVTPQRVVWENLPNP